MNIEDLYTLESHESGCEMEVRDQFGNPCGWFIRLVGVDSRALRMAKIEMQRALFAGVDPVDAAADMVAKCTLGWRGFQHKDKDLEFSTESARNLYVSAPYIADQCDDFFSDRTNFMKGREKS